MVYGVGWVSNHLREMMVVGVVLYQLNKIIPYTLHPTLNQRLIDYTITKIM
jgi:hypothetical protein